MFCSSKTNLLPQENSSLFNILWMEFYRIEYRFEYNIIGIVELKINYKKMKIDERSNVLKMRTINQYHNAYTKNYWDIEKYICVR